MSKIAVTRALRLSGCCLRYYQNFCLRKAGPWSGRWRLYHYQKETPTIANCLLWGSFRSKGDESETCQILGPMSYGPSMIIRVKHTMNTAAVICYLLSTGPQRQQSLSLHMSCLFTPIQYAIAIIITININQSIIILLSQMMPLLWEPSQLQRCLLQNIFCFSLILLVR